MPQPAAFSWSPAPMVAACLMLAGTAALCWYLRRVKPAALPAAEVATIGFSVEGRPILCHEFGRGPRTLLIKASIHGTEGAGTPLTQRLIAWLEAHPASWQRCRILVIPVSNPDGWQSGRRFNARGVDLNRNFPADNREEHPRFGPKALSEPESTALHDFILKTKPDLIVAIHQPLACIDFDGPEPAAALATRLAGTMGLPVGKLGARPGSLGAWFGETLGRPILTVELPPGLTDDPDKLWAGYGPGLVDLLLQPEAWTIPAAPAGPGS